MTTTFERLCAILVKDYKLDPESLTPDATLESLGIDSLGAAELFFNAEDVFGVTFPPEQVPLLTLGDVVRYIDALLAEQHGGKPKATPAEPAAQQAR
ncbi:Phosphopantetheine-binding protein [Thiomonas sp. X19]|uniref:acyl carrier protein n=1 Tax=Thiomonas sp. X19 TaxID=1050370 RepID=UPI000B6C0C42|nr:acyl carrier protein [Thiomonas sp. X19]SCC91205.1 Phosphopantetheine-binding protein [Thiomonas sp. X19]